MKKTLTKTVLYCCCIMSLCFTHACAPIIEEEETAGSISGIVSDKTTGEPIPTVRLTLEPDGASTVTGSDGSFSFKKVEKGTYTVKYIKEGYRDGEYEASVKAGLNTEAQLLMERIPAVITADRDILDFGDNPGVTSLSFNIVNSSYKPLKWTIDCTCLWIAKDGIRPAKEGILNYGKTATIIVEINRDELEPGYNETYLVIYSEDGSAEVKITAVGSEKRTPSLIVSEASEIRSSSAVLNGEIKDGGAPEYFERGFVLGLTSNPTIENNQTLTCPKTEESIFSYSIENLALEKTYHVRSYAKNLYKGKEVATYSSNEITFTTRASAPVVSIFEATELNVSKGTATLNGKIEYAGDPVYDEKGFVYATHNSPTTDDFRISVQGSESGNYRAQISGLEIDSPYYARAYAVGKTGIVYSEDETRLTLASAAPEVTVMPVSNLDVASGTATLNGNVVYSGNPAYTEKGFVYATHSNPTAEDSKIVVGGSAAGSFSTVVTEIRTDTKYYVRAYAVNAGGMSYSSSEEEFELRTISPVVSITDITDYDLVRRSVKMKANATEKGVPEYTKRGFVYADHPNPTVDDMYTLVPGNGKGDFESDISGLELNTKYYARAYLYNQFGNYYSDECLSFTLEPTAPNVSKITVSDINYSGKSAKLIAEVTEIGSPNYSEKGFVYGKSPYPTVESSNKIAVAGSSAGEYYALLTSLTPDCTYYARAYIIGVEGAVYGGETTFRITPKIASVSIGEPADGDIENQTIRLNGTIEYAGDPEYTEKGFVYGTVAQPVAENASVVPVESPSSYFNTILENIEINRQYYARAYARNEAGTAYSEIKPFMLKGREASVSIYSGYSLDMDNRTIKVSARILSFGAPVCDERGFVFSTTTNHPTIENNERQIIVPGIDLDEFNASLTDIEYDKTYYCRSYVKNRLGTIYNNRYGSYENTEYLSISTAQAEPRMGDLKLLSSDRGTSSMDLNYKISYPGVPSFYETGIVYSATNAMPTIADTKVIASGSTSDWDFTVRISNLDNTKIYYVRSYVTNNKSTSYSGSTVVYVGPEYLEFPDAGFATHSDYSNKATWSVASETCSSSRVGGYSNWRLPTMAELTYMASHASKTFYLPLSLWSGEYSRTSSPAAGSVDYYYYLTSTQKQDESCGTQYFRCVRSLDGSGSGQQNGNIKVTTSDVVSSHRYKVLVPGSGTLRFTYESRAVLQGSVELDEGASYTERGFILSKSGTPEYDTAEIKKTVSGTEAGNFTCTVSGLAYKTTYHFRAYAKRGKSEYIYGDSKTFIVTTSD